MFYCYQPNSTLLQLLFWSRRRRRRRSSFWRRRCAALFANHLALTYSIIQRQRTQMWKIRPFSRRMMEMNEKRLFSVDDPTNAGFRARRSIVQKCRTRRHYCALFDEPYICADVRSIPDVFLAGLRENGIRAFLWICILEPTHMYKVILMHIYIYEEFDWSTEVRCGIWARNSWG